MSLKKLKFKEEYIPLILAGRKRTTIRLEKKYEVGDIVYISDTKGNIIAKAEITRVIAKKLSELNENDAIRDGFMSIEELKNALTEIYGYISDDREVYIYFFRIKGWNPKLKLK